MRALYLFTFTCLLIACEGGGPSGSSVRDSIPPREATDPVPEPPTHPDTSGKSADSRTGLSRTSTTAAKESYYRLTGTEPFWSLSLGRPYSIYRSMEGDSLSFPYQEPQQAAGRQEEWAQLFPLGDQGWALLRKARTPCSDGMSDRDYTYTATVWLNGRLLDGCAKKE